jgi:hypothetical protein
MLDIWVVYITLGCDRNSYCLYSLHRLLYYYTQHKLPTSPEVVQIFRGCLLSCLIRHPVVLQYSQSALTVATMLFTRQQSVNTLMLLRLYGHSRGCLWTRQLHVREVPLGSAGTSFYVKWNSQSPTTELNH